MPQPFNNAIMTDAGTILLARAQAGTIKMEFTRIAVGNGTYTDVEKTPESLQNRTALKSQKNSYTISNIDILGNSVKVTALITNQDPVTEETLVSAGYYINEIGLFAKESGDEDGVTEILYSIAIVKGDAGDYMPAYNGNSPAQIIQDYYATVSNASEVVVQVLGGGAVALAEDLAALETPDFNDTGEVEGIGSFTDFMSSFVKKTSIYQLLANLKAGLKYVLHAGQLVNSGMCETPGKFALDAAYGHTMTEQMTQLYSDLGGFEPIIDETGKITGYKTTVGGADTVFPFSEIDRLELIHALANSGLGLTENSTPAQIYAALATKFPPTKSWIVPGWSLGGNPAASSIHSGNDYIQMTIYASGYGSMITYMNSPTIDITTFKTLSITGQGKRSTGNPTEGYQPKLYLVNASNGSSTLLFKGTSGQFSGPTIDTINVNYNVSSLSGNYLLRGEITNYEDGQNNGAYIYLTKALLSA